MPMMEPMQQQQNNIRHADADIRFDGFSPTGWAIYTDVEHGGPHCRGLDHVADWVRDWDDVGARLALWSSVTRTHSYVRSVSVTGRKVNLSSSGTMQIRVRVDFEDPEVPSVGGWMIRVGGTPFLATEAEEVATW